MLTDVRVWMGVEERPTQDALARYRELRPICENPGFKGDYHQVLNWYNTFSAHGLYPFGNGMWEQQPQWLLDDFGMLRLLREYDDLKKKFDQSIPAPKLR